MVRWLVDEAGGPNMHGLCACWLCRILIVEILPGISLKEDLIIGCSDIGRKDV